MTEPRWPVIEVFGPTVQGEGSEAGVACHFIRFGGCDYRCSWCDSMYAVDPAEVREHAQRYTVNEILSLLTGLEGRPGWVVLSGGNPALLDLTPLVRALQNSGGYKVAVETQGSRWKPWLAEVDRLTVSPKPPSSGMATGDHARSFKAFMGELASRGLLHDTALKIVVADDDDLTWAKRLFGMYPTGDRHLSVCTPQPGEGAWESTADIEHLPPPDALLREVADRYAWLAGKVAADPDLAGVKVLPQLHVIAWGNERGR